MKYIKTILLGGLMSIFIMGMLGCSSPNSTNSNQNQNEQTIQKNDDNKNYPRTIKHVKGETIIQKSPENAAALGFEDDLLSLKIEPKMIASYAGVGSLPYISERAQKAKVIEFSKGFNLEQLMSANPDYIIIPHHFVNQYEQLNKIAPTIVIDSTNWKDAFMKVAEIYAAEDKAKAMITAIEKASLEVKSIADKKYSGKKFMMVRVQKDNQFLTYGSGGEKDHDLSKLLYKELGLTPPTKLPAERFHQITLEGLSTFEVDHLFVINDYEPVVFEEIKKSTVWNNLNAVKSNQILVNGEWIGQSSGPLGKSLIIQDVKSYLEGKSN